ncbi:MAG: hypothetical protein QM654_04885 [Dysgonamonadaceae bacterium]
MKHKKKETEDLIITSYNLSEEICSLGDMAKNVGTKMPYQSPVINIIYVELEKGITTASVNPKVDSINYEEYVDGQIDSDGDIELY